MKTTHRVDYLSSEVMKPIPSASIDLVVTSPPYPMIEMWDGIFSDQSKKVRTALRNENGPEAFEAMHRILDRTWGECCRVLKPGGFACINIGDATRTLKDNFVLYPNHSRIFESMLKLGFTALPCILWRKQTNAPNKFMGSGMLPAGAYVTLEHEYILIFRKGPKRAFSAEQDKRRRRQSAIFWEERNNWFSDVWFDLKGAVQSLNNKDVRKRSGAFPFELAYRIVNMYSVKEDTILDPFLGTGTSMAAAMTAGRNSIGYEIDPTLSAVVKQTAQAAAVVAPQIVDQRLSRHLAFIDQRAKSNGNTKHANLNYGFPVVTAQEKELLLNELVGMQEIGEGCFEAAYATEPQRRFCRDVPARPKQNEKPARSPKIRKQSQTRLFSD